MKQTADSICGTYDRKASITIRTVEDDEDTIVIEADREGLEFLGNLFLAQAEANDCGFQLSPNGAGRSFFTENSTKGLYIHRLHSAPSRNKQSEDAASR